jgi:mannosyltransferase OCH1-like enzyme
MVAVLIANRLIKILASITKTFAYIFHFFFPHKRFTIPKISKPLIQSKKKSHIPKIIWQTSYSNKVSLPVYFNYLFNRLMSLDCEYHFEDNDDCLAQIRQNASQEVIEAFEQLADGAAKADLWRIFVLNFYGGVYLDIDAHFVWPIFKIIKPGDKELFLLNKEHYTNYFMASEKNNPIYNDILSIIVDNINQRRIDQGVYSLTGPTVVNQAIGKKEVKHRFYRYTCVQGSFTNEYFQYIDKPQGKWTHTKKEDILKSKEDA